MSFVYHDFDCCFTTTCDTVAKECCRFEIKFSSQCIGNWIQQIKKSQESDTTKVTKERNGDVVTALAMELTKSRTRRRIAVNSSSAIERSRCVGNVEENNE